MPIDKAKIMAAEGKPVTFTYPTRRGVRRSRGVLRSRRIAWADRKPRKGGALYADVVDIITFEGRREPRLRIGYYLRGPDGTQRWGSQTTITERLLIWRRILPALRRAMNEAGRM